VFLGFLEKKKGPFGPSGGLSLYFFEIACRALLLKFPWCKGCQQLLGETTKESVLIEEKSHFGGGALKESSFAGVEDSGLGGRGRRGQ